MRIETLYDLNAKRAKVTESSQSLNTKLCDLCVFIKSCLAKKLCGLCGKIYTSLIHISNKSIKSMFLCV
jgi:hypothetical protein